MEPLTKRQEQILKYVAEYTDKHGYGPTLDEIRRNFRLAANSTVHTHLAHLQTRGCIKREKHHARSITVMPQSKQRPGIEIPLHDTIPESDATPTENASETIHVPEDLASGKKTYALRIHTDAMLDMLNEQLLKDDIVIVEDRKTAKNGERVLAVIDGLKTTVRTIHQENGQIRLQADHPMVEPVVLDADRVQVQGIVLGMIRKY